MDNIAYHLYVYCLLKVFDIFSCITSKLTNGDGLALMFLMLDFFSWIVLGVDSFYEYLLKAHILFGKEDFWKMFHSAYVAVQKYFRHGPWYIQIVDRNIN